MIKSVTQHSYFNKNPISRWVDFKTTHQLDGCTQNSHIKRRKQKMKNKTSLQMLQEFARGHGRGEQGLRVQKGKRKQQQQKKNEKKLERPIVTFLFFSWQRC
jgi:hypothetical protein